MLEVKKIIFIIFVCLFSTSMFAQNDKQAYSVTFGPVTIGEQRLDIDIKNFSVIQSTMPVKVKTALVENSLQWVRPLPSLLTPRARLRIEIYGKPSSYQVHHRGKSITLQRITKNIGKTEVYVSLFDPTPLKIYKGEKFVGNIYIKAGSTNKPSHLIDYSCARYDLKVIGLTHEYISVGCQLIRSGKSGQEYPVLEVQWAAPNLTLADHTRGPYLLYLLDNKPAVIKAVDDKNKITKFAIKARLPKRLHRLKTALGLGPYYFKTRNKDKIMRDRLAAAFMIYGNYYLTPETSIRFFDALIKEESLFNNFGGYFAYDLGRGLDNRIQITALLGLQTLSFDYNNDTSATHDFIYPQGFEMAYHHAFGMKNHSLVFGAFISPSDQYDYQNLWLRFGKRIFWELNYISWGKEEQSATMWGLSIGFPFLQFL